MGKKAGKARGSEVDRLINDLEANPTAKIYGTCDHNHFKLETDTRHIRSIRAADLNAAIKANRVVLTPTHTNSNASGFRIIKK